MQKVKAAIKAILPLAGLPILAGTGNGEFALALLVLAAAALVIVTTAAFIPSGQPMKRLIRFVRALRGISGSTRR